MCLAAQFYANFLGVSLSEPSSELLLSKKKILFSISSCVRAILPSQQSQLFLPHAKGQHSLWKFLQKVQLQSTFDS